MSEKIIVTGHKNPDTDTVVSAVVWSGLLSKMDKPASPAVFGEPNKETELIFEKAGMDLPEKKELKGKDVFLVDHNEEGQRPAGVKNVVGVIDHHKLGISTDSPIFFRNEPLGSTSGIIMKIADERGLKLDEKESFLLLAGIVSDTLKFNSPTTTEEDKIYARKLAEATDTDIDELAEEMFKAKSDLSDKSLKEVIEADYKDFEMGEKKVGVGVAEVATTDFFEGKKTEIIEKLKEVKKEKQLDFLFFGVIDIIKKDTRLYVPSDKEKELANKAFEMKIKENPTILRGVASRKKQIIPPLSNILGG